MGTPSRSLSAGVPFCFLGPRMRKRFRRQTRAPFKVRLWDLMPLETQLFLIQRDLIDPDLVLVDTEAPEIPRLLLMESREQLERIMRQKPRYCIFQPSLRGLRSPKARHDRADHRKP